MHLQDYDSLGVRVMWLDSSQDCSAAATDFFWKDRLGQQEGRVALCIREQL